MDQKRFLLALALSFLLLLAYEQLVVRPYRKVAPPAPREEPTAPEVPGTPAPSPSAKTPVEVPAGMAAPAADLPVVTIETDLIRATITTLGARLKSWELKDFR